MEFKVIVLSVFVFIDIVYSHSFTKREADQPTNNILDRFRECMDKTLAAAVSEVNEKQLEPIFNALGDQVNRFSKAFDVLTAPTSGTKQT